MKTEIKYVVGDATAPKGTNPMIVHICNNVGSWGAGFVVPLGRKYPEAQAKYRMLAAFVKPMLLGHTQFVSISKSPVVVANMIAQDNTIATRGAVRVKYDALEKCLEKVATYVSIRPEPIVVHMPRIGCGIGGGTWEEVEPIIQRTLCDKGIEVVVYDLPS